MSMADLKLEISSSVHELGLVRDRLCAWCAANGWPQHDIADIVLAVDEALTNVIRHGYCGAPDHRIWIDITAIAEPQRGPGLQVCIRDRGRQVEPSSICGRDLDDLRPGGLGVHIIRSVMDFAEYSCPCDGGMQLVMRKFQNSAQPGRSTLDAPASSVSKSAAPASDASASGLSRSAAANLVDGKNNASDPGP